MSTTELRRWTPKGSPKPVRRYINGLPGPGPDKRVLHHAHSGSARAVVLAVIEELRAVPGTCARKVAGIHDGFAGDVARTASCQLRTGT